MFASFDFTLLVFVFINRTMTVRQRCCPSLGDQDADKRVV